MHSHLDWLGVAPSEQGHQLAHVAVEHHLHHNNKLQQQHNNSSCNQHQQHRQNHDGDDDDDSHLIRRAVGEGGSERMKRRDEQLGRLGGRFGGRFGRWADERREHGETVSLQPQEDLGIRVHSLCSETRGGA